MSDINSLLEGVLTAAVWFIFLSAAFIVFYRKHISGIIDPLLLNGFMVCVYLAGLLEFLSFQLTLDSSPRWILVGIFMVLFFPAFLSRSAIAKRGLSSAPQSIMKLFFYIIISLMATNLIVNYYFGVIPLFEGTQSRSEQSTTLIPTLVLLAPQLGTVGISMLAFVRKKDILILGKTCAFLFALTTILSGSKSAIIQLLIILLFYWYLRRYRRLPEDEQPYVRFSRWKLSLILTATLTLAPIYFVIVVSKDFGDALLDTFLYRLFAGFDIVFFIVTRGIDISMTSGVYAWDFYFFPFLKLFGQTPSFQSAGQYISAEVFGYTNSFQSLNPNSNLVVEWIMSLGNIAGIVVALLCILFVFHIRMKLLQRTQIRIFDMFLMPQFILAPFGILLDGSLFMLTLLETMALYFIVNTLANLLRLSLFPGMTYRLY